MTGGRGDPTILPGPKKDPTPAWRRNVPTGSGERSACDVIAAMRDAAAGNPVHVHVGRTAADTPEACARLAAVAGSFNACRSAEPVEPGGRDACFFLAREIAMVSRSLWKGQLRLSPASIQLELHSATESGGKFSFRQIHGPSGKRVQYQKIVPGIGPVDTSDILKGTRSATMNSFFSTPWRSARSGSRRKGPSSSSSSWRPAR